MRDAEVVTIDRTPTMSPIVAWRRVIAQWRL